jgi:hypothetical protein
LLRLLLAEDSRQGVLLEDGIIEHFEQAQWFRLSRWAAPLDSWKLHEYS